MDDPSGLEAVTKSPGTQQHARCVSTPVIIYASLRDARGPGMPDVRACTRDACTPSNFEPCFTQPGFIRAARLRPKFVQRRVPLETTTDGAWLIYALTDVFERLRENSPGGLISLWDTFRC